MYRSMLAIAVAAVLVLQASTVLAQCACGAAPTTYAPAAPSYTTYYAPAAPSYTTYYAPTVTYYPPTSYVAYYAPTTPYVSYYAPATSYVSYYAPAAGCAGGCAPVVQPYAAYYGRLGWSMYGTPKVYVPGVPVRNTLRAVTP